MRRFFRWIVEDDDASSKLFGLASSAMLFTCAMTMLLFCIAVTIDMLR